MCQLKRSMISYSWCFGLRYRFIFCSKLSIFIAAFCSQSGSSSFVVMSDWSSLSATFGCTNTELFAVWPNLVTQGKMAIDKLAKLWSQGERIRYRNMNAHIQEKRSTGTEVLFVAVRQVAFSIAEIERLIFVFIMCCLYMHAGCTWGKNLTFKASPHGYNTIEF